MPSIIDGLFAARSGIQSQGTGISVLADNISNANTTGFKYSRADFSDLIAGNLSGGATAGSGSQVKAITPVLTQGTFEFTGRGLDVGIDGSGYLTVSDANGSGQRFYTRAGNLKVDTQGNILNQDGYQVQGFPASGAGGLQALNVNTRSTGSVSSGTVTIGGNLDASAAVTAGIPANPTTFNALNTAAQFSTFFDVFDSLGAKHTVTTYFFKTAANTWTANGYVDAGDVGGTAGIPSQIFTTPVNFSASGALTAPLGTVAGSAAWSNGSTSPAALNFKFNPFTQFSSPSNISNIAQDGTGTGNVVGFQVEANGNVFAQLDNGQTSSIGFLALANFANPEALRRVGGSVFAQTSAAGEPVIGRPQTGSFGAIAPGALELSNSDIAADFIKLISLQKAFQGSSRVITNINDLLNAIVQLA